MMKTDSQGMTVPKVSSRGTALWLWLSVAGVMLAVIGNVIGLSIRSIYAGLTPAFLPQALAQDVANLAIVAPTWLILVVVALRGSLRAYLLWLGVLTFTVYNYVIYTFSVPFGPLFLVWVAVLGISIYALIGGIIATDHEGSKSSFTNPTAVRAAGWFLIITSVLFAWVWLSEDVPAALTGTTPQTVLDMALPTNPVHVLDLAFFLPAALIIGVMLLRKKAIAYTLAPALILFLILTGVPILLTPVIQASHVEIPAWGVTVPIGTLSVLLLALLIWLISTVRVAPRDQAR